MMQPNVFVRTSIRFVCLMILCCSVRFFFVFEMILWLLLLSFLFTGSCRDSLCEDGLCVCVCVCVRVTCALTNFCNLTCTHTYIVFLTVAEVRESLGTLVAAKTTRWVTSNPSMRHCESRAQLSPGIKGTGHVSQMY